MIKRRPTSRASQSGAVAIARTSTRERWRRPTQVGAAVLIYGLVTAPLTIAKSLGDIPATKDLPPELFIGVLLVAGAMTPVIEPLTKWVSTLIVGPPTVGRSIAIGEQNIQVGGSAGSVVNSSTTPMPTPRPRPEPVRLLPSSAPDLLGRENELQVITSALATSQAIELSGPTGIGKTALLRTVCLRAETSEENIVFRSARREPASDLLEFCFEAFYETPSGYKPTDAQLLISLQSVAGTIVLDDVELTREDLETLANGLPTATLLTAGTEARRAGEAQQLPIKGLGAGAALALLERELGRTIDPTEVTAAAALVASCHGRPYDLVTAAAAIRAGSTFTQLATPSADRAPGTDQASAKIAPLSSEQRAAFAAVAAAGGAPLRTEHVAAIAGPSAMETLGQLESKGIVSSASPSFVPSGDAVDALSAAEVGAAAERLLDHFLDLARTGNLRSESPVEDLDVARALFDWAANSGHAPQAIDFGRQLGPILAGARRWAGWHDVLETTRSLAATSGDLSTQAWSLHELGSRALALGDRTQAKDLLREALALRRNIGDEEGMRVSGHNLAQTEAPVISRGPAWPGGGHGIAYLWMAAVLGAAGLTFAGGIVADTRSTRQPAALSRVSVRIDGAGSGRVTSADAGAKLDCVVTCVVDFHVGDKVTLRPIPGVASFFEGWTGDCAGADACDLTLGAAASVTATFGPTITVQKSGSGSGLVTSDVTGIDCGNTCSANFKSGSSVTLSAKPAANVRFAGWSGTTCQGTSTCTVLMNQIQTVAASFVRRVTLQISRTGSGVGAVLSDPAGISCGLDCVEVYDLGTKVTLRTSATGSRFDRWEGACTGSAPTCTVTMDGDQKVAASFIKQVTLKVSKTGSGGGVVVSTPAGINCGTDCDQIYDLGTKVTLEAKMLPGSYFANWADACKGTASTCTVTMDADHTAIARFEPVIL